MRDIDFQDLDNLSKEQKELFLHDKLFYSLIELFNLNKIPNRIIFTGSDGIGKSTIIYHLINFLLKDTNVDYDLKNKVINSNSRVYKEIVNQTNFNFKLLKISNEEKSISIEAVREVILFFQKTTINNKPKICFVDGAENLNISSSNSLLKILEELPKNNFFFLNHNNSYSLIDTVRSRCFNIKISLDKNEQLHIKKLLFRQFNLNNIFFNNLTPGQNLKMVLFLKQLNLLNKNFNETILEMQNIFLKNKFLFIVNFLQIFIENYILELLKDNYNFNITIIRKKINSLFYNLKYLGNEPRGIFFEMNYLLNIK